MTDTFHKIKEELALCYPDITDDEVKTFIQFFKLSIKALHAHIGLNVMKIPNNFPIK